MTKKLNVAILFGGQSPEHEVSCCSAKFIYESMDHEKFLPFLIGIDKQGYYYHIKEQLESLSDCTWLDHVTKERVCFSEGGASFFLESEGETIFFDVVFPALHGPNGEDGKIQGLFEFTGIPYVGCDPISSAICMDKEVTKRIMSLEDINQVEYVAFRREDFVDNKDVIVSAESIGYPLFIKPANMGSSVGVSKAENREELLQAIDIAFQYDSKVIVEQSVNALELEIAVFKDKKDCIFSTVGCIKPRNRLYDYESKYLTNAADFYIPAPISKEKESELRNMAKKAFRAAMCYGLSRIDFLMDKDTQEIYFNEINTLPGFTSISLYPQLMQFDGIEPKELVTRLIESALERSRQF